MSRKKTRRVRPQDVQTEPGSQELVSSDAMKPYFRVLVGAFKNQDLGPALDQVRALPLEKRYVWRVASALKWGFADFDSANARIDRETLSPNEIQHVGELLRNRPVQFYFSRRCLVKSRWNG